MQPLKRILRSLFADKQMRLRVAQKGKVSGLNAPVAKDEKLAAPTKMPEGKEGMKQVQIKLKALGLYDGKIDGIATSSKGESSTTKGIKQFSAVARLAYDGRGGRHDVGRAARWPQAIGLEAVMAGMDGPQKAEKVNSKDDSGLAAPFRKLADAANEEAQPGAVAENIAVTGNFVDDKYWRSQNEKGESRAVNWGQHQL